ncbi:MAG: cbb3-type cytochrome oxidase assembly protein CcoS [Flavobacteriaceae bacterium]|nr:cbb3-type cytochrome oxidase assembly protein CcoS [Flavobacteriaceae bacterium]
MNIIYLLLTVSVIVAIFFFVIFIFSVKKGQYDDVYTPSVRMLFEDEIIKEVDNKNTTNTEKQN